MSHPTLSGPSGRAFCESLYHIASCGGLTTASRDALTEVITNSQLDLTVEDLGGRPLDYATPARLLDSTWLRRVLIQGCARIARMSGQTNQMQVSAIKELARALGLTEDAAVAELESITDTDCSLTEWLASIEVDYLSWDNYQHPGYFWKFPHTTLPIAEHATLRVHEGQAVLVRYQGEWTDLLTTGNYLVVPQTLPGYAQRAQWDTGSINAEFYFVRTSPSAVLRWGLSEGVELSTDDGRPLLLQAYGKFVISIGDTPAVARRFLNDGVPDRHDTERRFGRIIGGRFAIAMKALETTSDEDIVERLADLDQVRDTIAPDIRVALKASGLNLHRFELENVSTPSNVELISRSTRSTAMSLTGGPISGGRSTNLLLSTAETGLMGSLAEDPDIDSESNATAMDFPSTGGD